MFVLSPTSLDLARYPRPWKLLYLSLPIGARRAIGDVITRVGVDVMSRQLNGSAMVALMAMVMVLAVTTGCIDENGNGGTGKVTLVLAMPFVDARDTVSGEVYDATMDISKVMPSDADVGWTQVTVVAHAALGSVLLTETPLSKDTGMYSDSVEAWYVDEAGGRNKADAGDAIMVTGMDQPYQGGFVQVLSRGELVASSSCDT